MFQSAELEPSKKINIFLFTVSMKKAVKTKFRCSSDQLQGNFVIYHGNRKTSLLTQ
jgi:hypothetical protein